MLSKIINIFIISFIIVGCSTKVEYRDIYIPTKCDVDMPNKPTYQNDQVSFARDLVIYSLSLECKLHFCKTGEIKKECLDEQQ